MQTLSSLQRMSLITKFASTTPGFQNFYITTDDYRNTNTHADITRRVVMPSFGGCWQCGCWLKLKSATQGGSDKMANIFCRQYFQTNFPEIRYLYFVWLKCVANDPFNNKPALMVLLDPAWISNYIQYEVWNEITYPFPNVDAWEWINRLIPSYTYWTCDYLSMLGLRLVHVSKWWGALGDWEKYINVAEFPLIPRRINFQLKKINARETWNKISARPVQWRPSSKCRSGIFQKG